MKAWVSELRDMSSVTFVHPQRQVSEIFKNDNFQFESPKVVLGFAARSCVPQMWATEVGNSHDPGYFIAHCHLTFLDLGPRTQRLVENTVVSTNKFKSKDPTQ